MKVGRNDPCPCGSGKKYKFCCYAKDSEKHEQAAPEPEESTEMEEEAKVEADHATAAHKHGVEHRNDRSRFQGDVRGGSSTFRPRVNRGAQRGT